MRRLALLLLASGVLSLGLPTGAEAAPKARKARARPKPVRPARPEAAAALGGRCPADMVRVREFCIDRWESSLVDATSGRALSPWYPPDPAALARVREVWMVERWAWGDPGASAMPLPEPPRFQLEGRVTPKAVSRGGTVPNGYLTYYAARAACQNAGKRLCREEEWVTACRGERQLEFPYGAHYLPGKCNVHRAIHPAAVLHDNASIA
jgi:formylglycine-generating enzyme required for sulfatase activity